MASEEHRLALLKALATIRIPVLTESEELIAMLQRKKGEIVFADEDLPAEGRGHLKPLYIQIEVNEKSTRNVMVDNGLALCVCPLKMLSKFQIEEKDLEPSSMIVRAYDNSSRSAKGTF